MSDLFTLESTKTFRKLNKKKMSEFKKSLISSLETPSKKGSLWKDSVFYPLSFLGNDEMGKWGEEHLYNTYSVITEIKSHIYWLKDKNTKQFDGIYDLKINNKRSETKTSMRGTTNHSWQHECIYKERVWDYLYLIDIDINGIYYTVLSYDDFCFNEKHPVFNKKPTLRKGQEDKYKFDLSIKNLRDGVVAGLTFYYDCDKDNHEELLEFLKEKIS